MYTFNGGYTFYEDLRLQYPQLRIDISDAETDATWDNFLSRTPGASHLQTSLWAQLKASVGLRCKRMIVKRDDTILAGAQILIKTTRLGNIGYVPKGPVVHDDHELIRLVNFELLKIAKKSNIRLLLVQPPNDGQLISQEIVSIGFKESEISLAPAFSSVINLDDDINDILARMRQKTRYNIRLGGRQGIVVREGVEKDFEKFYQLYRNTTLRHKGKPEPYSYLFRMWQIFSQDDYGKMFLAELNGKTLAGIIVIAFGDTVIFKKTGWSGVRKLFPCEMLHWFAINWAKSNGYAFYDFEGIDKRAGEAILAGESLPAFLTYSPAGFKLGFRGKVVGYPKTYAYVMNPFLRWFYNEVTTKLISRQQLWRMAKAFRGNY